MADSKPADPRFELYIVLGLRTMLGDQKARRSLEKAKLADPDAFRRAMAEAESRYGALPDEAKKDPAQTLNALVAASAQLRARMLLAVGPRQFLASIPGALRRFLWK